MPVTSLGRNNGDGRLCNVRLSLSKFVCVICGVDFREKLPLRRGEVRGAEIREGRERREGAREAERCMGEMGERGKEGGGREEKGDKEK